MWVVDVLGLLHVVCLFLCCLVFDGSYCLLVNVVCCLDVVVCCLVVIGVV